MQVAGLGAGATMVPFQMMGNPISAEALLDPGMQVAQKKVLADVALNTAKSLGASYADARIGRYMNQFVFTREDRVQNVVNTESFGVGVRVIANGTWGFSSTIDTTPEGIKKATEIAIAIAMANSKIQKEPVTLAPTKGYGEVSWKTPIVRNAMAVPISEKVELLLTANAAAMDNGANFVNSAIFQVNEQKYFASSDGSYIDQDVHRIWPNLSVTVTGDGKFKRRQGLSAPVGMGYEYMDADPN
jgi:TldD protein